MYKFLNNELIIKDEKLNIDINCKKKFKKVIKKFQNIKTESFSGTFVVSGEKNGHLMAINANNASGETRIGMIYRNK